jgi:hypothetical protein
VVVVGTRLDDAIRGLGGRRIDRPIARRGRRLGRDQPRDRAFGIFVGAGVFVIAARKPLAHLEHREHAAHLDRPELREAGHHRQGVVGQRHFHLAHVGHA